MPLPANALWRLAKVVFEGAGKCLVRAISQGKRQMMNRQLRDLALSSKFQLNFPLLSDESKAMIQAYGVWKEKSMYGRKYMGIERTTVVINEDGTIRNIFPKVKVNGHFTEVLQALR